MVGCGNLTPLGPSGVPCESLLSFVLPSASEHRVPSLTTAQSNDSRFGAAVRPRSQMGKIWFIFRLWLEDPYTCQIYRCDVMLLAYAGEGT